MGWFSIDKELNGLLLVGEFDTVCGVDLVEVVSKRLDLTFIDFISSSSSTNRFQRRGLQSKGAVAIACCWRNSIKKFATMGLTGLP